MGGSEAAVALVLAAVTEVVGVAGGSAAVDDDSVVGILNGAEDEKPLGAVAAASLLVTGLRGVFWVIKFSRSAPLQWQRDAGI